MLNAKAAGAFSRQLLQPLVATGPMGSRRLAVQAMTGGLMLVYKLKFWTRTFDLNCMYCQHPDC